MKNLKRALGLALASIMVVGVMVVSTSASYEDVDGSHNMEAIEILQTVGIMVGNDKGEFNPDAKVTRNEMAVIMTRLLGLDYDRYRGVNEFNDVPDWAAPYVGACVAGGVTVGIGDKLYGGADDVTAVQASLMILRALGYFQHGEDAGSDWQDVAIRQAGRIGLLNSVNASAGDTLTRNQVAQLVLNGMKANIVDSTDN